jgi:2-haloalkanoic acid dehalogenase type II
VIESEFDIITFDCYGTLIDWESGITGAIQAEAAQAGVSLNRDEIIEAYMIDEPAVEASGYRPYRDVLTETARRVAARLGWKIADDRAGFLAASLPNWQPFPDTNSALERLARKFDLGILSNTDDDLLQGTRRHFTVDFALIVTAEQVKSYKPAHAHFAEGIRRVGGKRLLHAAQSYFHDVVPASEMGIPVAWVNRKNEQVKEGGPRPSHETPDLAALADLLGA